ncbi:major facilitator superfamily domain-containing protein [Elsinoe ampelina]|uniref:Major facilitator superfamily domain-containing protein n=1 Tax=Elsinoe ampelina TaxID=302913 RepID=A0A6A6GPH6_9PEZI|nr:major facilitator superfamily domain-containing protein [Elsinoe ampelina]
MSSKSKAHLRQRHGSDALRLERFDEDSSFDDDNNNHNGPLLSNGSQPMSPKPRAVQNMSEESNFKVSNRHNRSRSSAYMSPGLVQQTFAQLQAERLQTSAGAMPVDEEMTPIEKRRPQFPSSAPANGSSQPIVPTWTNMPCKPQLAILAASRFVDFFQMASLQTYMVHQLKSFDPSLPDSTISHQAGVLLGSFTAAQIITSILWGRLADKPAIGRKLVLNIGLVGTGISMIGVGFSKSYYQAVAWRVMGGAINGTVGAARTMVAETVDKRWHPRAFLLLPAAFNVANVAGPILGGLLVNPVDSFPRLFGENSTFGGHSGVAWMRSYPYAIANMLSTFLLLAEAVLVTVYLDETLRGYRGFEWKDYLSVDKVLGALRSLFATIRGRGVKASSDYRTLKEGLLSGREDTSVDLDRSVGAIELTEKSEMIKNKRPTRLPFRRIWTSNVLWTMLSIAVFDFHMGAFNNLWILFLSTSREFVPTDPGMTSSDSQPQPPHPARSVSAFKFASGLAFPPPTIGFAMSILGFIGIALQFLLYPWANGKFGLMRCFRSSLFLFPLAYFLAPYIALLPSSSPSPEPASGFWVWTGIALVLLLQVGARTFALPASIILLNNCCPHPTVLATIHGLGQADSATFRTLGPILAGGWYGTWLERGVVGMAWWIVAAVSALGCGASFYVRNGSGHEIFLEGEEEEVQGGQGQGQGQGQGGQGQGQGTGAGMRQVSGMSRRDSVAGQQQPR